MQQKKLLKQKFRFKETKGTIISDTEDGIDGGISSLKYHRKKLEEYTRSHRKFLHSFKPVPVDEKPLIAKLMAEATEKAEVGPMAAVAGVIADLAVRDMISAGANVAVVENGGEVSASSDRSVDIVLSAGDSPLSEQIGFRLEEFPVGVATSSGLFSHAFSFGDAEAVTIFAENAGIADGAATAIGNMIKGPDHRAVIKRGIREALSIEGVKGAFILYKGITGKGGKIPQIIKVKKDR